MVQMETERCYFLIRGSSRGPELRPIAGESTHYASGYTFTMLDAKFLDPRDPTVNWEQVKVIHLMKKIPWAVAVKAQNCIA
jgi:hypothetical protein